MPVDREIFEEWCAGYVLGALDGDDLRRFRESLKSGDPELEGVLREFQRVALLLPLAAEDAEPSPDVRAQLLRRIRSARAGDDRPLADRLAGFLGLNRPHVALGFSFVLVIAAAALLATTFFLKESLRLRDQQIAVMKEQMASQVQRLTAVQDELSRKEDLLKILRSPRIEVVFMNGLEANPAGYGKIIWDPVARSAILQISNIPPVPEGKDYQLWLIKGQEKISAGVFAVHDPAKESFFRIERLAEGEKSAITAFAITLEPKGGVPQPTGTMVLLGAASRVQ